MSKIDEVLARVPHHYFTHVSRESYVRILDTPRIWGLPFGPEIMPAARSRTKDFERAIIEVVQKTRFRCDVASLNSPDPSWAKVILGAIDTAMMANRGRPALQFRFLFGQTPMIFKDGTSPNLVDFQGALIRLVRSRQRAWGATPDLWMAKFFRLQKGLVSGFSAFVGASLPSWMVSEPDDDFTKMTWNHSKIIASDGLESLVGGHNLNMDLFTSYPPVHDVSVVMHGEAALGSQRFLDRMWGCGTDVVTKEFLDPGTLTWRNGDDASVRRLEDPLSSREAGDHRTERAREFARLHRGSLPGERPRPRRGAFEPLPTILEEETPEDLGAEAIREDDLQTLRDLEGPVFKEEKVIGYAGLDEYKKASRVLSIGKHWSGPDMDRDYEQASEIMKSVLIHGATSTLRLSQMDLVSAWKKKWSSHVVCHWIMEALIANPRLQVQVVVSPLDAGAGAEGDQYSFGSGACRTFELFQYYMANAVETDTRRPDAETRLAALARLHIAPFYYTEVPREKTREGESYFWPELTPEGFTATLKQPSLAQVPPVKGIIGSAVESVKKASGAVFPKVPSAPGNHTKIMIADDQAYVVGSDNLYPGFLSEFNYLIEGPGAVADLLRTYWEPLWHYSGAHCVNPACKGGCTTLAKVPRDALGLGRSLLSGQPATRLMKSSGLGMLPRSEFFSGMVEPTLPSLTARPSSSFFGRGGVGQQVWSPPLLHADNRGKVIRVDLRAPPDLAPILEKDAESALKGMMERRERELLAPSRPPSSSGTVSQTPPSTQVSSSVSSSYENSDKIEGDHYYTDQQIFTLLDHYLGRVPNVVVLRGINGYVLNRIAPDTYDEALRGLIAGGTPRTLVQPYNVNGNHWGLIFIRVAPPSGGARGQARVLYIDPLSPDSVPNLGPLGRAFPDLQVERCGVRYQNDRRVGHDGGQNSCGPWVIELARWLVSHDGALPAPDRDPREAALRFRAQHQLALDGINGRVVDDFVVVGGSDAPAKKGSDVSSTSPTASGGSTATKGTSDDSDDDDFVMV
ncbi:murine toxin [Myxococcus stipitatus DSM 14675]|uniref:Toxin n=1 Tax=Myxococcus stipitatus (strain DSM 14675 / JCM 12634 / Mx s8) TaxID=1278073 RepID=L7U8I5_MYXSD|nr:murine toxin [Myxococcus stipitatus]AGC45241.1 murine toxin [Myxococcus stipitatus DSM 14675]